ncbi:hypothetical protein L1987_84649 [Smallanthus sonchifolius]|uniref:Uncharacterized protein n=1 Tax=Smallanthus sonchifolius TaxID=185202 RepID=A0ACB8XYG7_9ASTR|nr:hypothetical protein L1987_84649 [Smallanthus sonchifolius]
MGAFYSAGFDPLFYVHHANVDRMWKLWKDLQGKDGVKEPECNDWKDASYVFYDENQELVRVYNKDCVDMDKLKYGFIEKGVLQWRTSRPPRRKTTEQVTSSSNVEQLPTVDEVMMKLPAVKLDKILKVRVKRPALDRTDEEKKLNEILVISGIEFPGNTFVKFDVFVNDHKLKDGIVATPCDPEFAGSFAHIPDLLMSKMSMRTEVRFGLKELLDDTNTEDQSHAMVTLVPRNGYENLKVGRIKIKLVPLSSN